MSRLCFPSALPRGPDSLKTIDVKGKVFSGKGEGGEFIKLPWVKTQISERLGFVPYSGTLNIKLIGEGVKIKKLLKKAKPMKISPAKGFCRGRCFKAFLMENLECAVVIPEIVDYPEDVIEVIASVNLRRELQLEDGNMVEVKILLQ